MSGARLHLKVVSPERVVLETDTDGLFLPGALGQLGILPGHAALMTALRIGVLEARAHGTVRRVAIFGGFAEIGNDSVTVLADGATLAEDVDVPSARAEKAAAELALATATAEELPAVRARIDAATARLEAARP